MIHRESRIIFSVNIASSPTSTNSSSRKFRVLFEIVPRDPNQRPLSPKVSRNFSFIFPLRSPDRGHCSQSGQYGPRSAPSLLCLFTNSLSPAISPGRILPPRISHFLAIFVLYPSSLNLPCQASVLLTRSHLTRSGASME
ncbi:unnamed protein product [Nezara viridula]|uniref:Uncharacterized protein n=1 Tax=Nezara viridula TaxID=85310 RepID=A0A9P0MSI1_NEZVI|nr:unnamed protein product [Nezara viridula]